MYTSLNIKISQEWGLAIEDNKHEVCHTYKKKKKTQKLKVVKIVSTAILRAQPLEMTLPLTGYMTFGKLPDASIPQFPHL